MSSDTNRNCPYCEKKNFSSRDSKYKHIKKFHSEEHKSATKEMPQQQKKTKTGTAIVPYEAKPELQELFTLEVMALLKRIEEKRESKKQILSEGNFFHIFNNIFFFQLSFYN
jgi:hypothetical protein